MQFVLNKLIQTEQVSGLDETLEAAILGETEKVAQNISANKFLKADKNKILFYSVAFGSVDTVKLLLDNNDTIKDDRLNTLLMIASGYNNSDMVNFILQKNTKLEEHNINGYSALTMALLNSKTENAKILLDSGAKYQEYKDVPEFIPEKAPSESLSEQTDILILLAYNGQTSIVEFILKNDYPFENIRLQRAVNTAIEEKENKTAELLINFCKEKNIALNFGELFQAAYYNGNLTMVKSLVKYADVNGIKNDGEPLKIAIEFRYFDIVDFLIENGADVNAGADGEEYIENKNELPDVRGSFFGDKTPLNVAIHFGALDTVRLLVEHGAVVDSHVINFAEDRGSKNILNYLKSI